MSVLVLHSVDVFTVLLAVFLAYIAVDQPVARYS